MDERNDDQRPPAEGVRIIGADEAHAALERGSAGGRRPPDQRGVGDVPPAPQGPRPSHRFPSTSVSPWPSESVPTRDPLPGDGGDTVRVIPEPAGDGDGWAQASGGGDDAPYQPRAASYEGGTPPSWASQTYDPPPSAVPDEEAYAVTDDSDPHDPDDRRETGADSWPPPPPEADHEPESAPTIFDAQKDEPSGERPITLGGHDLPHWTDPPTGEVPRILPGSEQGEDDLAAWQALGAGGSRWRDGAEDWDDVEELENLGSEETRVGALDTSRSEHSDIYSFDEDFERLEERRATPPPPPAPRVVGEPDRAPTGSFAAAPSEPPVGVVGDEIPERRPPPPRQPRPPRRPARPEGPRRPPRQPGVGRRREVHDDGGGGGELNQRVALGVGLVVLLLIFYFIGSAALMVLSAIIIGASAAEGYGMLRKAGFRPATLLGLVSSVAIVGAAYWRGVGALPLVVALTFAGSMVWYMLRIVDARPLANIAVTNLMFIWVGLLGSFGALLLRAHDGRGLFLGAVIVAVGADVAAYFAGSQLGNRSMAPSVSPGKTWEGAAAGLLAALIIGAIIGKAVDPWGGMKHGLVFGLLVGIVGPIGDLSESMIKRDLGIKNSGNLIPGHGGLLDRFDAVLFVLPVAYYLAAWTGILR